MAFPIVYLKYSEICNYFPVLKNKIKIVAGSRDWMPALGDPGAHAMGVPSRHGDPREDNGEALPYPRQEPHRHHQYRVIKKSTADSWHSVGAMKTISES